MEKSSNPDFFKSKVLGHPAGLFVLFFTEMWERFSFYGMRVLLVNFLTMAAIGINPGWEWDVPTATALFGTYVALLYITPIWGGIIADKYTGYRLAVLIGALIMTAGHAFMAAETEASLYIGLALLVIGTGFFKPNMTSIISEMYKDVPEKKDGAYTIFYMGVNAGAFFGMLLCGYLGEKVGWSYGFGLAGIFMLLGSLQFWLAKPLFGSIGQRPQRAGSSENIVKEESIEDKKLDLGASFPLKSKQEKEDEKRNPFTFVDIILTTIVSVIGLMYIFNKPLKAIYDYPILPVELFGKSGENVIVLFGLVLFVYLLLSRIRRYSKVVGNRMIAITIFAIFTMFFWASFEQAAHTLVLYARDFTERELSGNAAIAFNIVNTILTVGPLAIISWVLIKLSKETFSKISWSNVVLASSFLVIWGIVGWMLWRDFNSKAFDIKFQVMKVVEEDKEGNLTVSWNPVVESHAISSDNQIRDSIATVTSRTDLSENQNINLHLEIGRFVILNDDETSQIREDYSKDSRASLVVPATVIKEKSNQVEVAASWFSILNSFFIIAFASFFSKWWESKYNPPAAVKYGLGLGLVGIGFGMLAIGAIPIVPGTAEGVIKVSMIWLILAYFFHTLGELCLSPVGLSYLSKLVPGRMIAFMFGMWYLAIAIGNYIAAELAGYSKTLTDDVGYSGFFLILTVVPIGLGVIVSLLHPLLKRLMGGVK